MGFGEERRRGRNLAWSRRPELEVVEVKITGYLG